MSRDIFDLPAPPPDVRIAYGAGEHRFGKLRVPDSPGPHPVVIAIHGGFWRSHRTLHYLGHLCEALRRSGIATWNLEYSRAGQDGGGFPGTLRDIAAAAAHLAVIAREYPLDLSRVVAAGHSAGGQLALFLANSLTGVRLRGAVSLAGVADLHHAWERNLGDGAVHEFIGGSPADRPEAYREASPIENLPFHVPHRLIHGDLDDIVPIENALRHMVRAAELGDDCRLVCLPGAGHFEVVDPRAKEWTIVQQTIVELLS